MGERRAFAAKGWQLEMKHWSELASFYHQVVLLYEGIFGFIGLIVSAVVIFSVPLVVLIFFLRSFTLAITYLFIDKFVL